jgi:hypothetical protein
MGARAVFLHGFAKKDRDNIDDGELEALREIADSLHEASLDELEDMMAGHRLTELTYDDQD